MIFWTISVRLNKVPKIIKFYKIYLRNPDSMRIGQDVFFVTGSPNIYVQRCIKFVHFKFQDNL